MYVPGVQSAQGTVCKYVGYAVYKCVKVYICVYVGSSTFLLLSPAHPRFQWPANGLRVTQVGFLQSDRCRQNIRDLRLQTCQDLLEKRGSILVGTAIWAETNSLSIAVVYVSPAMGDLAPPEFLFEQLSTRFL